MNNNETVWIGTEEEFASPIIKASIVESANFVTSIIKKCWSYNYVF